MVRAWLKAQTETCVAYWSTDIFIMPASYTVIVFYDLTVTYYVITNHPSWLQLWLVYWDHCILKYWLTNNNGCCVYCLLADLYYGGDTFSVEQPQSFTCPYCGKMGYTETSLQEHVTSEHAETSTEVVSILHTLRYRSIHLQVFLSISHGRHISIMSTILANVVLILISSLQQFTSAIHLHILKF